MFKSGNNGFRFKGPSYLDNVMEISNVALLQSQRRDYFRFIFMHINKLLTSVNQYARHKVF